MLGYVMLCYVMLCYVMLCYILLCYDTLSYIMLYSVKCINMIFYMFESTTVYVFLFEYESVCVKKVVK